MRRESRKVLVFVFVAALLAAFAALWYYRFGRAQTTEERAREKAGELRDRVRGLTH